MRRVAALLMIVLAAAFSPVAASAQVTLEFNRSDASTIAYLRQRGYDEIKITSRELLKTRVEACKDGVRYTFKIRVDGRVYDHVRIGDCGRVITEAEARAIARQQGLRRIQLSQEAGTFVAIGCAGDQRQQLTISAAGQLLGKTVIGNCRRALSSDDIAGRLQERGFDRVTFVDKTSLPYLVDACFEGAAYRLRISRGGDIVGSEQRGNCAEPINPRQIAQVLREQGYDRIEVIDRRLPRYIAEACRGTTRVEVTLDRFGATTGEIDIGECSPPVDSDTLRARMVRQGFYRIDFSNARRGYAVIACLKGAKLDLTYSRYGDVLEEANAGRCSAPTIREVAAVLEARGLRNAEHFVEGCRQGQRIRFGISEYGGISKPQRTGQRC